MTLPGRRSPVGFSATGGRSIPGGPPWGWGAGAGACASAGPARRLPEVAAVSGSNFAEVGVAVGQAWRGRRTVTAFSAIDNLVKGGAGQAIQNMNVMLGLDERASLEDPGPWPP